MLGLALMSSLYPLWQLWHIRPADLLRAGSSVSAARTGSRQYRLGSMTSPFGSLIVNTLSRSLPRTLLTIMNLFLSTILLILMIRSVIALQQSLQGTLLGVSVLLQTAVPQLAGCAFAVLLTFLSVADLLLLRVRERRREIGLLQAVGWRPQMVQRLFVQEGVILSLISAPLGILAAQGILIAQHTPQQLLSALIVAGGALLLMVSISVLAAIPALRAVNRMQVMDVLRAE